MRNFKLNSFISTPIEWLNFFFRNYIQIFKNVPLSKTKELLKYSIIIDFALISCSLHSSLGSLEYRLHQLLKYLAQQLTT